MSADIQVVPTTAGRTAVVRQTTTWDEYPSSWRERLDQVYAFLRSGACPVRQGGHNVMLYLDDVPNVEVGVQVSGPFVTTTGRVEPSELPAGRVATMVHRGPYDGLDGAHRAVRHWCVVSGYERAGPWWEIYGDWHGDASLLETELCYLLR